MERVPALYKDIANLYTHIIKQDSPEAGAAIEQIHAIFGARAALRATLVLTLLKMEVKENYHASAIRIYGCIFDEYPEAVQLLDQAIMHCQCAWGVTDKEHMLLHHFNAQTTVNPSAAMLPGSADSLD